MAPTHITFNGSAASTTIRQIRLPNLNKRQRITAKFGVIWSRYNGVRLRNTFNHLSSEYILLT